MDTTFDHSAEPPVSRPYVAGEGPGQFGAVRDRAWRRSMWIGGLLLLALVVAAVVWFIAARSRTQTATVTRRNVTAWETLRGEVIAPADRIAVINCHCSAPVSRVFTAVGMTVHRGDVLVELSHPTARSAYDAAQAELIAARTAYDQAHSAYRADVAGARQRLAQLEGRAQATNPRAASRGEVPTGLTIAEDGVPSVPGIPDEAVLWPALDEAWNALVAAQENMTQNLTAYEQRLRAAEVALHEGRAGRTSAYIRAPVSGQVVELNVRPGVNVDQVPDTIVATIADLTSLKVNAPVSDEQQTRLQPGMYVALQLPQLPSQTLEGQVATVQPWPALSLTATDSPVRPMATISFVNRQGMAKPNMGVRVMVRVARAPQALAVPVGAVQRDRKGHVYVQVRRGDRWVRQTVRTGLADGLYVVVAEGVEGGGVVRVVGRGNLIEQA